MDQVTNSGPSLHIDCDVQRKPYGDRAQRDALAESPMQRLHSGMPTLPVPRTATAGSAHSAEGSVK